MIPILTAFLALVLVAAGREFLRRARWIDRVALVAFLALAAATRPDLERHRTAVADAIVSARGSGVVAGVGERAAVAVSSTRRLVHRDYFVASSTTLPGAVVGVGLFGRVFVLTPGDDR